MCSSNTAVILNIFSHASFLTCQHLYYKQVASVIVAIAHIAAGTQLGQFYLPGGATVHLCLV